MFQTAFRQFQLLGQNSSRLFRIAPKELRGFYLVLGTLALLLSLIPILADFAWGEVINVLSGDLVGSVWVLLILYLLLSETNEVLSVVSDSYKERLKNRLERVFGELIPERKSRLTPEMLERPDMQNQISRVSENAEGSVCAFVVRWFEMVQCVLIVIVTVAVLSTFAWWIALLLLFSMAPALYVESKYGRDYFALEGELSEPRRRYESNSWDLHLPRALAPAKVLGLVPLLLHRIVQDLTLIEKGKSDLERRYLPQKIAAQCVTFLVVSAFIFYLIRQVTTGELELGTANFYLATMEALRVALREFFQSLGDQLQDSRFVTETFDLFKNGKDHHSTKAHLQLGPKYPEELRANSIGYTYPTGNQPVLSGVDALFKRGTVTALVGGNGSGKSTLVQILAGVRKPTSGVLIADSLDVFQIAPETWWRECVAYMPQQPPIFDSLTVGEHILRREVDPSRDEASLQETAGIARLHRLISRRLPYGYSSRLSSSFADGRTLSGGQRQRLSWAAVIASNRPLWLLDEPFSALDQPVSEHFLALLTNAAHQHGRTVIVVTHDQEVTRMADQILVMDGGRIVERGTHDELTRLAGRFTRLFQSEE